MRKGLALLACSLAAIVAGVAHAETESTYAVKFVCGTQAPDVDLNAPAEPPVKPGNYATVINVEGVLLGGGGLTIDQIVSLAGGGAAVGGSLTFTGPFVTQDITCTDIARTSDSTGPGFITGYVNLYAVAPVSITAVYTTQGCSLLKPTSCLGPTDIDVVPQQPVLARPQG
jgi:hypothetical protein